MDIIFKALNDPARRDILDRLRERDEQTLSELEARFEMTRFGVMKHLAVLEESGLVMSKKKGRFKHHYLNAVPLQEVIDRWIEPLIAKPVAKGIITLKSQIEGKKTIFDTDKKPDFVHQTLIRCTQDALWDALTRADQIAAYHFVCDRVDGDAEEGKPTDMIRKDGSLMLRQKTTKLTPKTRIEQTFEPHFFGKDGAHSTIVFVVEPEGAFCKLTCEHCEIPAGQDGVKDGWMRHFSSLKSWLETGQPIKMEG